jgi:transcription elongation GreA/GreB family factor
MTPADIAACEDRLLASLDNPSAPASDLLDLFGRLAAAAPDKAGELLGMLEERLVAAGDDAALLRLFRLAAAASRERDRDPAFRAGCVRRFAAMAEARRDRRTEMLLRHAGFDKPLYASECLRRLDLLRNLAPGALCLDRSRGFGVVAALDDFAQQVVVDYESKPGHRLSLGYAAECLTLLGENHLFAIRHRRPDHLADLLANRPAEVVKMAIRDFGPMAAPQLQDTLVGPIVPADRWKSFWDAARKALKADPLVAMPARRSDPIRLLDTARAFDTAWFAELAAERDLARILERVDALLRETGPDTLAAPDRAIVLERLAFVAHGAFLAQPEWRVRALLAARQLGAESEPWVAERLVNLLEPESWNATLPAVSTRAVGPLLDMLLRVAPEAALARLRESALDLPAPVLDAVAAHLANANQGGVLDEAIRARFAGPRAPADLLLWLARRPDSALERGVVSAELLAGRALTLIEEGGGPGDSLRALNQLRECLVQPAWWVAMLARLGAEPRQELADRLRRSAVWSPAERRALLDRIAAAFPDLKASPAAPAAVAVPPPTERVTSIRSYQARQAQLHKIMTVDMPQCSRDIGVARGYGDLRENYEYKAAKEAQAQLMRRQEELEKALAEVRPVAFDGPAPQTAGPGAHVVIRHADGRRSAYTILGEWDHDDGLAIISCASALARALAGRRAGDTVEIPAESGAPEACVVESVGPIPDPVRAWLQAAS